jgi:hypothetical protein
MTSPLRYIIGSDDESSIPFESTEIKGYQEPSKYVSQCYICNTQYCNTLVIYGGLCDICDHISAVHRRISRPRTLHRSSWALVIRKK